MEANEEHKLVNGVFKGGGAKGLAYAGALTALKAQGIWFGSVAGASAGAITAALIAAGLGPDEMRSCVPDALGSVRRRLPAMIVGAHPAIYDSSALKAWLEKTLRAAVGLDVGNDVSFADLYAHSGIALYVVAMDLETRRPIVFNHRLTPDLSVAAAVTSSCAIPAVFEPGRGVTLSRDCAAVHPLVDGGAWANYPAFVFRDGSFRAWAFGAAPDDEEQRPTVGFVLGDDRAPRTIVAELLGRRSGVPKVFDLGSSRMAGNLVEYLLASVLGARVLRFLLLIAAVVSACGLFSQMPRLFGGISRLTLAWPGPLHAASVLSLEILLLVSAVTVTLVALAALVFGRAAAETLVPAAKASLGVATGTPPWIGAGDKDYVITLSAPGVKTTSFRIDATVQNKVLEDARTATLEQLASYPDLVANPTPASEDEVPAVTEAALDNADSVLAVAPANVMQRDNAGGLVEVGSIFNAFGLLWLFGATAFFITTGSWGWATFMMLLGVVWGLVVLYFTAEEVRVAAFVKLAGPRNWRLLIGGALAAGAVGVGLLVWASQEASDRRARILSRTDEVTIVAAREVGVDRFSRRPLYRYDFRPARPTGATAFEDPGRFAVGDSVLVEGPGSDPAGLGVSVPGAEDYWGPLFKAVVGLGATTVGARMARVARRDHAVRRALDSVPPTTAGATAQ